MKKIKKEKLSLQKATIAELNTVQMIKINGGSDSDTITTTDTTNDTSDVTNPRLTYTTCSSKYPSRTF